MNTQFRKGVIEMCVMALISKKDMYGYEIVGEVAKFTDINEGTIYPILRRLTKEGYFNTYLVESNSGPVRKYYKITPIGRIFFDDLYGEWHGVTNMVNKIIVGEKND